MLRTSSNLESYKYLTCASDLFVALQYSREVNSINVTNMDGV